MLQDIGMGRDSFGSDPKSKCNKSKKLQVGFIKLKIFHAAKEIINSFKIQLGEWRTYLQNFHLIKD